MKTLVSPQLWTSRRSSTEYWLVAASGLVLLGAALVGWWLSWLSASTATFCFLLLAALVAKYSRSRSLGIADLVTLTRGLGVCFLAGLALQALAEGLAPTGVLTMIIVSALCLTLDGLDGKVARARGEATAFGARFDMETDAAMLAILSIAVRRSVSPAGGCWRSARCDTATSPCHSSCRHYGPRCPHAIQRKSLRWYRLSR